MLLFLFVVTTHSFVCHHSCLTCSGPNSDQCLLCSQGTPTNGVCQCNLGLYQNGICKSTCEQGYYQLLDECIACVEHCKTCQNSICSDCVENFVLVNQEFCQPSCNQGYYYLSNSCVQLVKSSDVSKVIYQAFNSDINQCEVEASEFIFDTTPIGMKCKYFQTYTLFGDNYVWHSRTGRIYLYDLNQHQFIRLYLKAFFADQWNYGDYLQLFIDDQQIYEFKITNNVWGQYLMTDILTNSTHTKSDLTLKIKVFNQGQTGYFGINNLQLITDVCGCAQCDSGQCKQQTSWGGSCLQNQLFVDSLCVDCILLQNRMSNCECISGYFLNSETNQCELCSTQCLTCKYVANYCLTCNVNRKSPSICFCNDGYYENEQSECTVCPSQCLTCSDANNCLKCKNAQFDAPKCECKYQIVQDQQTCLKCTQQNLSVKFSAVYNQIILTFENNFSPLSNKCQNIFLKSTLDSFGEFSQCKVTGKEIKVFMDDAFSYTKQNSSLQLNSSNFIMENCLYPLQNIFLYYLDNVDDGEIFILNQNQIYLKKDSENIIAYQTNIKKTFDLKWQILQLQQNDEFVETLINSWNQLTVKQNFILLGSQFKKNNVVNFTLQYCDFSGKCGLAQLDVIIELDSVNQNLISITSQNPPFYENQKLTIKLEFNGQSTNITQSILINYQFIGKNVNMQQTNYTLNLNDFLIITIEENQLQRGEIYQLTVQGAQDQIDFLNIEYFYLINQALEQLKIKGGSKQVSYSKPLLLALTKNNIDQTEQNNQFNLISWECKSLATNNECLNQLNELVLKVNNVTILNVEKFTFPPYTAIEIIVYAMKENTLYSDKASFFFIEDDIPQLDVEILNNSNIQKNNDYDKIQFKLKLQSSKVLIDECIYSNSIISNFQIIAYYIFHYPELKVMLSDFYDLPENENLIYKFSVLIPYYQMPSISSVLLKFNAPPKLCKLNIIHLDNQFYKINVNSCNKEDQPLQYRFGIKIANQKNNLEEQTRNIYLNEFSYKNYLITQLVNFMNETQNITVFADVLDIFLGKSYFQLVVLVQPQKFSQAYVEQISQWFTGDSYTFQVNYLFQYLYINKLDLFITEIKNTTSFSDEKVTNMQFKLILEQVNLNIEDNMIDQISSYLEVRINQIQDDIQNLKMENQYQHLNQLSIEFNIESCLKEISLFLNLLNKQESNNRRILSEADNQQVLQYINKLGDLVLLMQLPNEEKKQFQYENFCLIIQQITNKMLNTSEISLKMVDNSYISIKQIKLRSNEMTSSLSTPMFQETTYPIQTFNISTQEGKEVNQIDEGYVRYNFELQPEDDDNYQNTCVIQTGEGWDEEQCQTIKEQNQIVCQCSKVSYTTISQIIINFQRNLFYLFSDTNLKKIQKQNYVEVLFLYLNIMITTIYIWFLFYGKKLDSNVPGQQESSAKVFPQEKTAEIFQKKFMNSENETYNKVSNLEQIDIIKYENANQPRSSHRMFDLAMGDKLESEIQTPNVRTNLEIQEIKSILKITDNKSTSLVNKIDNGGSITKINMIDQKTSPSTFQIFQSFYKNYHKIIALYFKNDQKQSRALRGTLIYISLLGQMSLINWFGEVYDTAIVIFLSIMSYLFGLVYKKLLSFFLSNTLFVFQYLGYIMATLSALFFMFVTVSSIPLYHDILFCNLWALSFIIGVLIDLTLYTTMQIMLMFWVLMKFKQFTYFQKIFKRLLDPVCYAIIFETQ